MKHSHDTEVSGGLVDGVVDFYRERERDIEREKEREGGRESASARARAREREREARLGGQRSSCCQEKREQLERS